jgi:hypothetical protein
MSANTYLQVSELDFDDIRSNLKTYLSSQSSLKDYDFEGSVMSTLLDVLSYNTHYNAYYLNMVANEMFLDTAQQRDSVVSRAKELGYTPVSSIGATAEVNINFSGIPAGVAQVIIPKNSKFTSTVDDVTYTFVTPKAERVDADISGAFSKTISIKEGEPLSHSWTASASNPVRYIIPNAGVDTSSITVRVQESAADATTTEFKLASNITQVFSTSAIFFIEESADRKYEIIFGSGSLGKSIKAGNIITVDYLVNNAEATNGASTFSVDSIDLGLNYDSATITSVATKANGGRQQESVDSIKFSAPRNFQTQNRAVVAGDYEQILLSENADLQSVVAFGGEQASPPQNGKVLIAAKPFNEKFLTTNRKAALKLSISDRTPLAVDPVIVDGDYTYLIPRVDTYYDLTKSSLTQAAVEADIRSQIEQYAENNLQRFGNKFRYSRFVRTLDNAAGGYVLNNDAKIRMQKRITPNTESVTSVEILFNNAIRKSTLSSSQFTYSGFTANLDDDGLGVVRIFRYTDENKIIIVDSSAGTIDYTSGRIFLPNFALTAYADLELKVTVTPENLDVIPVREQVLLMEPTDAIVNVIGEQT